MRRALHSLTLRTKASTFILLHFLVQSTVSSPFDKYTTDFEFNYTSLVIFGDSYSVPPAIGGRYSNGPVWNEFLSLKLSTSTQKVTRLNYAYNGAHINNQLTSNTVPDTKTQISNYISDLHLYNSLNPPSNSDSRNVEKVLHMIWIGINPLISLWRQSTLTTQDDHQIINVFHNVSFLMELQIDQLSDQIESLIQDSNVNQLSPQFVILTPPLLHITQLIKTESNQRSKLNPELYNSYLSLMEMMETKFSKDLINKINLISIQNDLSINHLSVFDTIKFWKDVEKKPKEYGITTPGSCITDLHLIPCKNPNGFQYWDSLHPTSNFHSEVSSMIYEFLKQIQSTD
ncbi:uncharacterized protein MELLADRAFT_113035 [Melampsora larici-populina 98AG31]|uniref:Carbohydrate esterase family 16 protein n=1 Tax=Melampsora larici-populina (strain 98AG31 / pathotype 3-4-7) TaxID=747676 RepID=F4S8K4_MELLP|nr:uncharacterized protein MELLADRAFT_113035 [Melampsora larici-populina 98AG31]EGF99054.1 hypothetical protein MELLADRAFT_113035 [Melampsora larici-populina 98AG31]